MRLLTHRTLHGICVLAILLVVLGSAGRVFGQEQSPAESAIEGAEDTSRESIALETDRAKDRAIERRLGDIFANIRGLEQVSIECSAGVVAISGDVESKDARDRALSIARQVEGVVEVVDLMSLDRDLQRRLAPSVERVGGWGRDLIGYLPLFLIALGIVGIFWLLSRMSRRLGRFYRLMTPNAFLARLVRQIVQGAILLIGIVLALSVLDASGLVQTVLGAAGLLGLALSFALRDMVENYIASILLSVRQPFLPNDEVLIAGHQGRIIRLTSRATVLLTLDGNHVRIPNATVFKGVIVNYSQKHERRFDFTVGVDTGADLMVAQNLAIETLRRADGVLDDPPPTSRVEAIGDSSVLLWIAGWVDQRLHDHRKVRSEALRLVKEAFDAAEIEMPEPIYRLRFEQGAVIDLPHGATKAPRRPGSDQRAVHATVDIGRDLEIDEIIAEERAGPAVADLLDPGAPRE